MTPDPAHNPDRATETQKLSPPVSPPPVPQPTVPSRAPARPPRPSRWGFWIPLALQTLLIAFAPAQALYLQATGETVVLQTVPVDPYDILRGYYVTLRYDISDPATLEALPGWEAVDVAHAALQERDSSFDRAVEFYVVLAAPTDVTTTPPPAWTPVAVQGDRPTDLAADQIALRGAYRYNGRITYDLERYYIPEAQRTEINNRIADLQRDPEATVTPFVVEVKVGPQGHAMPVGLWLDGTFIQF